jgi:hypothetical protein
MASKNKLKLKNKIMNQEILFKINHPKLILFVQGLLVTICFIGLMLLVGLNGK